MASAIFFISPPSSAETIGDFSRTMYVCSPQGLEDEMASLESSAPMDTHEVAKSIKGWLDARSFETSALAAGDAIIIKARKRAAWRAAVGADRALEVVVNTTPQSTIVDVRQGSWTTNAVSNAAWLVATGGTNLLISGWSVVIQKELEQFVQGLLQEAEGTPRPIEL